MSQWRPIDSAPKDDTLIDLWVVRHDGTGHREIDRCWDPMIENWTLDNHYASWATHWMPRPEPPPVDNPD